MRRQTATIFRSETPREAVLGKRLSFLRCRKTLDIADPLYLFACHLEWHRRRSLAAYQDLLAALDDPDEGIRAVAETLLQRNPPRPTLNETNIEAW